MRLLLGDCLEKLKELDDNSIDSIVTDPPYGLSFMGKKWDYDVPKKKVWKECMRVLKPGGYLLAFAGSRTYHQMAYRIEKAGFEIRDQIMWIYGSGFPKSMNISKQIDKKPNADLKKFSEALKERRIELGLSLTEADKLITGGTTMYSFLEGRKDNDVYPPNKEYWEKIKEHFGMDGWSSIVENNLKVVGEKEGSFGYQKDGERWEETRTLTETTTDLAKQWEGWGTALKPAHEPIVMARKPLSEKTVVDNVLEWGTGGINIDDSRISTDDNLGGGATKGSVLDIEGFDRPWMHDEEKMKEFGDKMKEKVKHAETLGRFPANVIFDEEAGKILDEQSLEYSEGVSRFFYCPKTSKRDRNEGLEHLEDKLTQGMRANAGPALVGDDESGRTTAKNNHPTVKPTDLMLYLIRLVTPKGGTTLDPFMGSGSTGKAAVRGGFDFVGIEREEDYMEIAKARIQYEQDNPYNEEKGERVEVNKNSQKFW